MTRDEIIDWVRVELNQVTKETIIYTKKHSVQQARYCFGFFDGYAAALHNILDLVEKEHVKSN